VSFYPSYSGKQCPYFRTKVSVGNTEPRMERILGMVDIRRKLAPENSEKLRRLEGWKGEEVNALQEYIDGKFLERAGIKRRHF